jgi:para-aminobenzoate synthetase component 1
VSLPGLSEVFARLESPSILGGNPAKLHADGFSYWAAEPKEILELLPTQDNPFEKLHSSLYKYKFINTQINLGSKYSAPQLIAGLPKGIFLGGWIGYFSYNLGKHIEKIPPAAHDDLKMPLVRLCFYDKVIAYDHAGKCFWLIALGLPDDPEEHDRKIGALESLLAQARDIRVPAPKACDFDEIDFTRIRCNMDKTYYLDTVKRIKQYIRDGDVYQVNFSQRFECDYSARPIALFHWLNRYNPSGYAAYIDSGDCSIVSASPEMFITICDGRIHTKPIKGTRPRLAEETGGDPQAAQINTRNCNDLLNSEKEQAELNMIIDLERNDLAKICIPGTRTVTHPRTIEKYPTVFHAVATVGGELREAITFCDIIRAVFPGGSITGAPKIRTMGIIAETEPTARGVYTGSIGFVGLDGSACLNIAIRTVIIKDRRAYVQVGGGIVADSEAEAEWQETITKARALLAGIKATQGTRHHA